MADKSAIEWTDATWNPVVGCSILSPGCTHCYAMKMAGRIEAMGGAKHYAGTTKKVNGNTVWTGKLAMAPDHILLQPLAWRAPRRIFVNSMGDLFHEDVPDEWIDRVFAVMALAPQHTFQVLTKRARRMREYLDATDVAVRIWKQAFSIGRDFPALSGKLYSLWNPEHAAARAWPLPNVWLGVSAERQQEADERIPELLATPAAIRFVSAEPLLGPIDFRYLQPGDPPVEIDALNGTHGVLRPHGGRSGRLDWIIVGGESGPDARPMHPAWARSIRDQCKTTSTAFFFKQWGEHRPLTPAEHGQACGATLVGNPFDKDAYFLRVGKKAAGRLLDGVEHNAMPGPREVPAL
ncbi:phage Gp37/Gp68 family protein [Mesorhizobium sp. B2-2-4]|uniref:DUF5131 family protein n=1 Tax=unclassified Mesorhizobium TaxID=325217 RepID=UPI00112AB762|nr:MULTISPECIES: phage Gp37/Gp68 family protein [unclassified Mesorhizobium]TPM55318.1 phage Gp37/Gp68 family protein [Mesorhizobium sp. B2-2-4]TPM66285.1 phage Gp37/Gp68 family protein [Mesorhizobium sp. B2-2-1]TPN59934.1 phage Gp37/Gp68 family protein [Mesorhizobium sp. B1-1-3]